MIQPLYTVTTYDIDLAAYTAAREVDVPTVNVPLWGVRAALRALQECGYDTYRGAPSIRVERTNGAPLPDVQRTMQFN